jgi:hypothetical protein
LEDYRAGTIRYPLQDLEAGWHDLRLRAWDVTDQYAEASIRFFVVREEDQVFDFSAYPNPFSESTCLRLKSSLPSGTYEGKLQIMNTSGQMMEELNVNIELEGSEMKCLEYRPGIESKDLFSGLYFFRLKIIDPVNNTEVYTAVQKLVYIK